MTPYSWHPAAKTNAIYLDGTETPDGLVTDWLSPGDSIGVFLHTEAEPRRTWWAGAKERIKAGKSTLNLDPYAAWLEDICREISKRGLHVNHIFNSHEQYGDAQGLYQIDTGNGWSGDPQPGIFEAAGLGPVSGYRDPDKVGEQIAYSEAATLRFKQQLDDEIHRIIYNWFGADQTILNYNWGHFERPKDGLPMPAVCWGEVSNPITYGPQKWGDRLDEFVSRLVDANRTTTAIPMLAASTYYETPDTFKAFAHAAKSLGVETCLLWHPARYRYATDPAVALADADFLRSLS